LNALAFATKWYERYGDVNTCEWSGECTTDLKLDFDILLVQESHSTHRHLLLRRL
jgi:predicted RecB family nuclease